MPGLDFANFLDFLTLPDSLRAWVLGLAFSYFSEFS